jgi:hypothetical protein
VAATNIPSALAPVARIIRAHGTPNDIASFAAMIDELVAVTGCEPARSATLDVLERELSRLAQPTKRAQAAAARVGARARAAVCPAADRFAGLRQLANANLIAA